MTSSTASTEPPSRQGRDDRLLPGPAGPAAGEVRVRRPLRLVVGAGGALQLALALVMFVRPSLVSDT